MILTILLCVSYVDESSFPANKVLLEINYFNLGVMNEGITHNPVNTSWVKQSGITGKAISFPNKN